MKKGFTLLELVVVIVIIGILATLGLVQYTKVMEKARTAEARAALGLLRTLQIAYYQEPRTTATYATAADIIGDGLPLTSAGDSTHYFWYGCTSGTGANAGTCTATRSTAATSKSPVGTSAYTITLSTAGILAE